MLIPFTIDPDIFVDSPENLSSRKKHSSLLNFWYKYGVLVIPCEKELDSKLLESINKAPQSIQTIWKNGLKNHRKKRCSNVVAEVLALDIPISDEHSCEGILLASLDQDRGELWGLDENHYSKIIAKNLEICRFGDEAETDVVKEVIAISERPIIAANSPLQIWNSRFSSLADNSRVITIVDRYAIKNFILAPRDGLDGLEFFISKIAVMSAPSRKIINIFSSYSISWNLFGENISYEKGFNLIIDECKKRFHRFLGNTILEISINLTGDSVFGRVAHYRYVLFDQRTLIQLDTGLESLGTLPIKDRRTCTCSRFEWWSEAAEPFRADEKKLKDVIDYSDRIAL
jgi:hypothetical protein